MARPTDWWVLDLDSDPTPGDPYSIRGLARRFLSLASDADDAAGRVRALAGNEAVASWVGESGDAYRDEIESFPKDLDKLSHSYGMAGQALQTYARDLDDAQQRADQALTKGREARAQLDSAQTQVNSAYAAATQTATAVTNLQRLQQLATAPGAFGASVTLVPSPDQVTAAIRNHHAAQTRLAQTQAGLTSTQDDLDAARRMALQAKGLREQAEDTAVHQLKAASHAGIRAKSFWGHIKDAAAKTWHATVAVATVAAVVLGVVALFVSGPLVLGLLLAASAVLLVDTLNR
ncbi:putative T7SS-secreted protein, partial [Frankia sp. Cppng1_Ct_nod]|uniref:WXG100 family type VII secretion target n=1 Tax=Frankia sp. Cppng1_Ct_nod TaxID=2897162 RepID=UPI0020242D89